MRKAGVSVFSTSNTLTFAPLGPLCLIRELQGALIAFIIVFVLFVLT